jgi:transcriptional regulator with XRE-family HTH domain
MSNPTRLAEAMRLYMAADRDTARKLSQRLGMSHTTLSRFLYGKEVSTENFMKILNYLMGTVYPKSEVEHE